MCILLCPPVWCLHADLILCSKQRNTEKFGVFLQCLCVWTSLFPLEKNYRLNSKPAQYDPRKKR